MKKILRSILYSSKFGFRLYNWLGIFLKPEFVGWGMATIRTPPWKKGGGDQLSKEFHEIDLKINSMVGAGDFALLQCQNDDPARFLKGLKWRHYHVFWTVKYVSQQLKNQNLSLVELGVCDGLTAIYAVGAAGDLLEKIFLYDAWASMEGERLESDESDMVGVYDYLSVEQTKENLSLLREKSVFNVGYIPDSFEVSNNPSIVHWLHIDLNSSIATKAGRIFL